MMQQQLQDLPSEISVIAHREYELSQDAPTSVEIASIQRAARRIKMVK